jgi:hypothetical protein
LVIGNKIGPPPGEPEVRVNCHGWSLPPIIFVTSRKGSARHLESWWRAEGSDSRRVTVSREVDGSASGGITGDQITVGFSAPQLGIDFQLTGQVSPDGSAHGTGWEMDSQLKCMSNAT